MGTYCLQLGAYFALIEVGSLLKHTVEQQLREAGDLSYVQFQLLARLGDAPCGSHPMTDLADDVVYSRSGLTYQAQSLEQRGLVTRAPSADDERGTTVTITEQGRDILRQVFPGHIAVLDEPSPRGRSGASYSFTASRVSSATRSSSPSPSK